MIVNQSFKHFSPFAYIFPFLHNREWVMWPVYIIFDGNSSATTDQVQILNCVCDLIHDLNWDINFLDGCPIIYQILSCEKPQNPSVGIHFGRVKASLRILSFMVDIVPELNIGPTFIGLNKLVNDRLKSPHILLQLTIYIKLV